ncbi:MAG: PDC sensor domain-containing protein [Candidatus Thiothrix moscowensis]|nr:PDC sensor domain-containing protein [Candidatus Thiothrix moscowensis]
MRFPKFSRKVVAWLFVGALTLTLFIALNGAYQRTDAATTNVASRMMEGIGQIVTQRTTHMLTITESQIKTNAVLTRGVAQNALPDTSTYWLPIFWKQLELNPYISALYIADTQGNFIKADRLPRWATRVIDRRSGSPVEQVIYRQTDYSPLANTETATQYDPRTRPWYSQAQNGKAGAVYWSDIYTFASSKGTGVTASTPFFDAQGKLAGVLAADMTLQGLSDFLTEQAFGDHDLALIVNGKQELVAYPTRLQLNAGTNPAQSLPTLDMIMPAQAWVTEAYQREQTAEKPGQEFKYQGDKYLPMLLDFPNQASGWKLLVVAPEDDLLGGANRSIAENLTLTVFALLLFGFILFVVFGKPFRAKEPVA